MDFESHSQVALVLLPNRALYRLWPIIHLNPTVELFRLVFQVIDVPRR
jgi:hypothetical protein